jgi:hypothetical protein
VKQRRTCIFPKYANQRGAKSAKSLLNTLLALLVLPQIGISPHAPPHARRVRACEADLGGGSASLMTSACAESPLIHCSAASQEAHLYAHLRGVVPLCAAGIRLRAGIAAGVQGKLVTVRSSMYADYDKSLVPRQPASQARSSRRSLVHVVAVIRLTYTDSGRADERTRTALLLITSDHSGVAGVCRGLQMPHV